MNDLWRGRDETFEKIKTKTETDQDNKNGKYFQDAQIVKALFIRAEIEKLPTAIFFGFLLFTHKLLDENISSLLPSDA